MAKVKDPELVISGTTISRKLDVGAGAVNVEDKSLVSFYEEFAAGAYVNTGLLPVIGSGLLSFRQAGDRQQFVYQHAPGVYFNIWGAYEGSADARNYMLAMPYRIVIGDHVNGQLRGARHFYSMVPITSLDTPLYAINVPNVNTTGYGGTSVGWICLYHTENYDGLTTAQRIFKTLERASGHEAFNDGNMDETDGPRFYARKYDNKKQLSYLWDPGTWEKKSAKEGFEWTLNPEIWIPLRVKGIDDQDAYLDKGVILTLEMAMYGNYKAYYPGGNGEAEQSLMNLMDRKDLPTPKADVIHKVLNQVFVSSKKAQAESDVLQQNKTPGFSGNLLVVNDPTQVVATPNPEVIVDNPVLIWDNIGELEEDDWEEDEWNEPGDQDIVGYCINCEEYILEENEWYKDNVGNYICAECYAAHYMTTTCCELVRNAGDLFKWEEAGVENLFCYECHTLSECVTCNTRYLDSPEVLYDNVCFSCGGQPVFCHQCNTANQEVNTKTIALDLPPGATTANNDGTVTLCMDCFTHSAMCKCGLVKPANTVTPLPNEPGINVCEGCVNYGEDGSIQYVSIYGNAN